MVLATFSPISLENKKKSSTFAAEWNITSNYEKANPSTLIDFIGFVYLCPAACFPWCLRLRTLCHWRQKRLCLSRYKPQRFGHGFAERRSVFRKPHHRAQSNSTPDSYSTTISTLPDRQLRAKASPSMAMAYRSPVQATSSFATCVSAWARAATQERTARALLAART